MKITNDRCSFKRKLDDIMWAIGRHMVQDFRSTTDFEFGKMHDAFLRKDINAYRSISSLNFNGDVYWFKQTYQLESLFKRYTFEKDVYTPAELEEKAQADFLGLQQELSTPKGDISSQAFIVFQRARRIIKRVLGPLDWDEVFNGCEFGRRANLGVPYKDSYLDVKVERLTGSPAHLDLFQKVIENDTIMTDIQKRLRQRRNTTDQIGKFLKLTCVPKSFKAFRTICPNTVLGAYFSAGLGRVLEDRLRSVGLNISNLQEKHGLYAERASRTREWVTADLSKASDLPTIQMVNRMVPREWFNALKLGRIGHFGIEGKPGCYYMASFMAMGIGYTFPLETLIFWALLKAIQQVSGCKGLISVYGDDLIYPRQMHRWVAALWPKLGLKINLDKTFSSVYFRESCGSDFYRGVNVRPFSPETPEVGSPLKLESVLYALFNGLLSRWTFEEIPQTLLFLKKEILSIRNVMLRVPLDFPDSSGIKVELFEKTPWYEPWAPVQWNADLQCPSFHYIRESPRYRAVNMVYPYYWEALRRLSYGRESTLYDRPVDSPEITYRKVVTKGVKRFLACCADKTSLRMSIGTFPSRKKPSHL